MTGRELIIYILTNGLEDRPVFENGKFVGFLTDIEAAEKMNVGVATVQALAKMDRLASVNVSEGVYIPANLIDLYVTGD